MSLPENVVDALVGEAFSRLDSTAQKVMQALAIYNRPVAPAAIDYLLQPYLLSINSAPVLQRLVNMHFTRRESGKFYLHPVDREYAISRIPHEGETTFTQITLTSRAADYFARARKPRKEWKKLDDLSAQLAEFDLRCTVGDYDTATGVLTGFSEYLLLWGHNKLTIDLHLRVKDKLEDKILIMSNLAGLGNAYFQIGKIQEAIRFHEEGLALARQQSTSGFEGVFNNSLGNNYALLGNLPKAIEFYKQALVFSHDIGDKRIESACLGNLGTRYAELGDLTNAIELHKQALAIYQEVLDKDAEINCAR